jgi:hypothetical protein
MRILFRALSAVALFGFVFNLAWAQKSMSEIPDAEHGKLKAAGDRESHQGPDNPMQGNTSKRTGPWGGPDPYGPEGYKEFAEKNERLLNDPQCQLQIDLQDPKRIVINHPDGTSQEYWYVLFRVINKNVRPVRRTALPTLNPENTGLEGSKPLETRTTVTGELEAVPVVTHLEFELDTFTRNVEPDPWSLEWPADPDEELLALSDEAKAERRARIKKSHRAVSDPYVMQRIAEQEEMWEWAGNSLMPEQISLLHPLSDFQRQIGRAFDLTNGAPDLSGPRCLGFRQIHVEGAERTESMRYVAVYGDNTYAGTFGTEDPLPEGATLVTGPEHAMWGKITQRRYAQGDCVDRFGIILAPNDPGYLNARIAGGEAGGSYGILGPGHAAIGQGAKIPHVRMYREGDAVLFNFDTGIAVAGQPNATYRLNGKLLSGADPRFAQAGKIDSSTQMFGAPVVGKPVKVLDRKGRAIFKTLVTYQPGDTLTQAEWDIYSKRLGPVVLARYQNIEGIVGRPLTADDPVVGMPRIKMGYFAGDAENNKPETLKRGINTGRKGTQGEVILDIVDYETGRHYDPRVISPADFRRDPDGTFTTNRIAPVPQGANLNPGEEYIYAPLGQAGEGSVPVPKFDAYGAWEDYRDQLSTARIPLTDAEGKLVHDSQDQVQYLKDYEYEYLYLHEFAAQEQADEGFKGAYGGDRWKLITEKVKMKFNKDNKAVAPLMRRVFAKQTVRVVEEVDGFELRKDGKITYVTAEEYKEATGAEPGAGVVKVKVVRSKATQTEAKDDRVVGLVPLTGEMPELAPGTRAETEAEAEAYAKSEEGGGYTIQEVDVIRHINKFRNDIAVSRKNPVLDGKPLGQDDFEENPLAQNNLEGVAQTWRRWTVPPPLVYRDPASGEWQVITRLADKIGPATRWDGADAPRFITRFISEMWGVAIFKGVDRDWDWANVRVRGLRGTVARSGLKVDENVTSLPNPADAGATRVEKAFFTPRMTAEDWVYWVRYERLGDEFENFRDLIRKQRTIWYRESDSEVGSD